MTSEVVLMNRLAVAMAADSAVTVGDGTKIYQSAIKLFTLSKFHPIGVMIYHTASILGYPWETIIKAYRQQLGRKSFAKVSDYCADFRRFLHANERGLFSPQLQEIVALAAISESLDGIVNKMKSLYFKDYDPTDGRLMTTALATVLAEQKEELGKLKVMECFPSGIEKKIEKTLRADTIKFADEKLRSEMGIFFAPEKDESVMPVLLEEIVATMTMRLARQPRFGAYSGLVFAGFGEEEFLPSMLNITIGGVVCNQLKWHLQETHEVDAIGAPVIRPFAESTMANTFINGIDPDLRDRAAFASITMVHEIVSLTVDSITELSDSRKKAVTEQCGKSAVDAWRSYQRDLRKHMDEKHRHPLQQVIASLPKDELAEVAESMVSLNALKMRVSQAQETVGGPIDVAVITKGDGFIWIKRKHYFKTELNPQFVSNYFRSEDGSDAPGKKRTAATKRKPRAAGRGAGNVARSRKRNS